MHKISEKIWLIERLTRQRITRWCVALIVLLSFTIAQGADQATELQERKVLRVCADPENMPYSNDLGEGFENRIAEMLAEYLGIDLEYTWYRQTYIVRFIRSTLRRRLCDVVIGMPPKHEAVLNTNPVYYSVFSMVHRKDMENPPHSLSSTRMATLKVGVVAAEPPAMSLEQSGLYGEIIPYPVVLKYSLNEGPKNMISDVINGSIDVALIWGPYAGYFGGKHDSLQVVPLFSDNKKYGRLVYEATMGVRAHELQWKRVLNRFIRSKKQEIDSLLKEYRVPISDEAG